MKRIIYTQNDGGVAVVIPSPEFIEQCGGIDAAMSALLSKDVPSGVDAEIIDVSAIPSDRTFRNAWEKQGNAIAHNLTKCKTIAHDKRRARRAVLFAPLDAEATIPAKAAQAEAARQAIRDADTAVQNSIDAATTPEQLKQILMNYQAV